MFRCSYPIHMMERWSDEPEIARKIYLSNELDGMRLDYALARCVESSFDIVYLDFGPDLRLDSIRVELNGASEFWSPRTNGAQALRFLKLDSSEVDAQDLLGKLRELVKNVYPDGVDLVSLKHPAN